MGEEFFLHKINVLFKLNAQMFLLKSNSLQKMNN